MTTLAQEAFIKTLAVMTRVDYHTDESEVKVIQELVQKEFGVDLSSADVRLAAAFEYIERQEIADYLDDIKGKLSHDERQHIVNGLNAVISADEKVADSEQVLLDKIKKVLG